MADLLVNDYYNLLPEQAANFNASKYFYKNESPKKGKQSGTLFVDKNAVFTSAMIGGLIVFAANADGKSYSYNAMIVAVVDSTTLRLDVDQNIEATDYIIWYGGVQFDQNGNFSAGQILSNGASVAITKDFTLTAAQLTAGGSVVLFPAYDANTTYRVRDIKVNYSASGLSGGGGNRLLSIMDGTTSFNNAGITAALLGTPVNTVWGGTGNPLPGTIPFSQTSAPGTNIIAKYLGVGTDYASGSVTITVTVERVS